MAGPGTASKIEGFERDSGVGTWLKLSKSKKPSVNGFKKANN